MNVLDQIWLDGRLLNAADATISALDHGVTVGDGVFETMQVVRGQAFALGRHLRRLRRSADILRLTVPYDDTRLRRAVRDVLAANPSAGRVRVTVTGGPGPLGSSRGETTATVIVAAGSSATWEPVTEVVIAPWLRNQHGALAGVKSTSYAENVLALEYAHDRGASEAVFANTSGDLCEGTGTNIFLGVAGRLVTPPLSSGCLAGITRELVIELVDVAEENVPVDALRTADEAFVTSSTRDVQPIAAIEGEPLASCPGPLTLAAAEALADLLARDLDP